MMISLLTLTAAVLFTSPEVEPLDFKAYGRWKNDLIDAAVQRYFERNTSPNERAELAALPTPLPYLYLSAKRLKKLDDWEEDPILLALAASIRTRLKNDEFAKRIDLLMEAGIITANKPPDPRDLPNYKWKELPAVGRHTDPTVTRESLKQMQIRMADLSSNPVIDGYMTRMEQKWKRRLPVSLTYRVGSSSFFFKTTEELLRRGKESDRYGLILAGDRLELDGDRVSVHLGGGAFLLRHGMNLRPNATTEQVADEFAVRFFICGDTANFGSPFTMLGDQSVVVVDGDLTVPGYRLTDSLFVATGSIHIIGPAEVQNCWFVAGDTITAAKAFDTSTNTFVAGNKVAVQAKDEKKPGVRIEDKAKADLGLNFFKSEEVGITFDPKEIAAVVKAVADDSPFRHVLKPGDVVTAINDRETRNEGAARRALREAVVLGFAFVTRTRGTDPATMTLVYLPDLPKPPAKKPAGGK